MTSPFASWSDETPYFAPQIQLDPRPPAMGAGLPFNPQRVLFNYIDDAVEGTVKAMELGKNREIYHIGDKDEISIEELTKFTGEIIGFKGNYEFAPTFPGSVARRCPDISKAEKELNYQPKIKWRKGLKETIDWYVDYLNTNKKLYESFYDNREE